MILIKFKDREAYYMKYLDYRGEKIYYNLPHKHETYVMDLKQRDIKRVIESSSACHNFAPFKTKDGKLMAIGGMDNWKANTSWRSISSFKEFKEKFKNYFKTEFIKGEADYLEFQKLIKIRRELNHCDGLYLFHSHNGVSFDEVQRIITTDHPGFLSARKWGKSTEFDTYISCVYDEKTGKYFLYIRANVAQGSRFIQYSTSDDLINWSEFNLINMGYNLNENYYSPVIEKYNNSFIGMIPYFNDNDYVCLRIIVSNDGINWRVLKDLFKGSMSIAENENEKVIKNSIHAVGGYTQKKHSIKYFLHHNYFGHIKKEEVYIQDYTISAKELNKCISTI